MDSRHDGERLVTWAYQDERIKRMTDAVLKQECSHEALEEAVEMGVRERIEGLFDQTITIEDVRANAKLARALDDEATDLYGPDLRVGEVDRQERVARRIMHSTDQGVINDLRLDVKRLQSRD